MQAGTPRVQRNGTSEAIDRLLVQPGAAEHDADRVERGRRPGQQRQGASRSLDRLVGAMQAREPATELRMCLRIGRSGGTGLADQREAFADTARFRSRDAADQQAVRAARQAGLRGRSDS